MNPLGRRTRRADDWASPHERARTRAAQWLDWPLDPAEAAWLEGHLGACRSCRRRANEYLENRDRLRTLRDVAPPPPRDLWARTAAAIEVESQRRRRAPMRGLPLGALSGVVVIVVVLGATLLSNTPTPTIAPPTEAAPEIAASAAASLLPGPAGTPFLVAAGDVRVVQRDRNGSFGYGTYGVDSVCPKRDVDCPMVPDPSATALEPGGGAADDHRLAQRRAGHRREQARRVERERGHRVRAAEGERGAGIDCPGDRTAGLR